ncbi:MAG: hypothetical protein KAX78_00035, partial [Phycisphaerae bacterium]|nr:hypothetical protein [Phycisphaerae bacterium]
TLGELTSGQLTLAAAQSDRVAELLAAKSQWSAALVLSLPNAQRYDMPGLDGTTLRPVVSKDRRYVFLELTVSVNGDEPVNIWEFTVAVADGDTMVIVDDGPLARAAAAVWAGEQAEKLDVEDCTIVLLIRPQVIVLRERERKPF